MINLYSGNLDKSLAVGKMLALASGGFMGFVGGRLFFDWRNL